MSLSSQQRQKLQEALIDAFPTKPSLEQMLSFQLDKNLDAIAGGDNLGTIVFNLIRTANSQGWVEDLVRKAHEFNPGNPLLEAIARELLRNPPPEKPPDIHPKPSKQKILVLAAIPYGLSLDKEIREIEEAIKRSVKRDLFEIKIRTAVRPQDIRRAIAEESPSILHFCGHGMENGALVLEDDGGNHNFILPTGLAELFRLHTDSVKCVLLNACYSAKPAEAISKHIDYVIGINQPIKDKAAIIFAQGFYDGLGYENRNNQDIIQRSFDEGIVAIHLEKLPQELIPNLWKLGIIQRELPGEKKPPEEPKTGFCGEIPIGNYNQLRYLLERKAWQQADLETVEVILQVTKMQKDRWLKAEHIANFSCSDLRMIDQLWVEASLGQFGFSVQRKIWLSVDGQPGKFDAATFRNFGDLVGWRVNDNWLIDYKSFNFSLGAPKGHLPSLRFPSAESGTNWLGTWQDSFKGFLTRMETCL